MNATKFLEYIESNSVFKFTIQCSKSNTLIDLSLIDDESIRNQIIVKAVNDNDDCLFILE